MWTTILDHMLRGLIREGSLTLTLPNGERRAYHGSPGPASEVYLRHESLPRRLVLDPELALGEGYMEGSLTVAGDDLHGLFRVLLRNRRSSAKGPVFALDRLRRQAGRRLAQANPVGRAARNVSHHYDISDDLYALFLGRDWQYSCAYFPRPDLDLDAAQAAKKALIARKLRLEPGQKVLDIGCGWGGLALTLAQDHRVRVTGITLSQDQHRRATARVAEAGLQDQIEIRLVDYRKIEGQFDRIVSVGMFEHVGPPHYAEFFDQLRQLLAPGGLALLHTIGQLNGAKVQSPWIRKYIFPGGHIPALSEIAPHLERSGLFLTDLEVWRLHYARTLNHWTRRFDAQKDRVLQLFDENFYRMWRYYLIASEMTFIEGAQAVFQLQMADRLDGAPITRDYLFAAPGLEGAHDIAGIEKHA